MPKQSKPILITELDYFMGRDVKYPVSEQKKSNAKDLLSRVNDMLIKYDIPYYGISSGYRPAPINAKIGGSKRSAHISCKAVDLRDKNGQEIAKILMKNPIILEEFGLFMEHPDYTKTWVHLQTRSTKRRIFIPY